jgi:uncharacterized protein (TIGR00725 family)
MVAKRNKIIAVIGSKEPSEQEVKLAEEVGRELGRLGITLICGGLTGVMEAACRGADSQGGLTIGVIPTGKASDANQYVKIPVVTNLGYARNIIVVKSAQAVIAIGGSYGTLSEIAYALDSKIPVVGLRTWSLSRGNQVDKSIIKVRSAKEAVRKALELMEVT